MAITLYPITPDFVAEVGEVDLSRLSDEAFAQITRAFWRYAVLIFPEQHLSGEDHLRFAERFGPIEADRVLAQKEGEGRLSNRFSDISNLDRDGRIWAADSRTRMYKAANRLWHTDSSFKHRPSLCSLLYARRVAPIGGHTEFADQRAAYDALPAAMQARLAGLVAWHSIETSRRKSGFAEFRREEAGRLPPVPQLLVRTIPQTGRKTLFVASHAGAITGMADAEAQALLAELTTHVTSRQFVYTHRWRANELVLWDNRCTLHRGTDYDDLRWVREMQRATVSDIANSCEQEGVAVPAFAGPA